MSTLDYDLGRDPLARELLYEHEYEYYEYDAATGMFQSGRTATATAHGYGLWLVACCFYMGGWQARVVNTYEAWVHGQTPHENSPNYNDWKKVWIH